MPITVERLEPRIYQSRWVDFVNFEDMLAAAVLRRELAAADNAPDYISVVDVSRLGSIPFDLGTLRKLVESDPRVIVENLMKASHVKIELAASTEDAIKRAHALFDER